MALHAHVRERRLGRILAAPIDVILADSTIAQPDIVFVRAERDSIIVRRGIEGAPDLVVEILSASSLRQDRTTKAALYARFGVPHYWIVDPDDHLVELYELSEASYRLVARHGGDEVMTAAPFPELRIRLADVWS